MVRVRSFLRFCRIALAALATLIGAAVAGHAAAVQLAAGEAPMASTVPFEDTYWKLTEFDGKPFEPASSTSEAHVIFKGNGKFAGYAICNSMFSSYTHDDKALTLKPIGMTMRGCTDPADDDREQRLAAALRRARGWQVEGDRLALLDEKGAVVARFQAVAQ